jgi:hypothetical protein
MSKHAKIALALALLFGLLGLRAGLGAHDRSDFDRVLDVGPGGSIDADIELGGGISFDHGSLRITSHAEDVVRILAESSGWGTYAVAIEVEQEKERISLVGRVDGALHWMFGGPEVDVTIWVPRDFDVSARIDGGPLVMDDLTGPIRAEVRDAEATVRRAEGPVALRLLGASALIEDVDGELAVEIVAGRAEIVGVRGPLEVRATSGGHLKIDTVIGPVRIETDNTRVEIEDVQGSLEVRTKHARVDAEEIIGDVVAHTTNGGIHLEEVEGRVVAMSRRGTVQVEFAGAASGDIETESGRIEVRIPDGYGFDLDARSDRGRIRIDDFDDVRRVERIANGEPSAAPQIAAESARSDDRKERRRERKHLRDRIAEWRERAENGDWQHFGDLQNWGDWHDWEDWGDWEQWDDSDDGSTQSDVMAQVNGGGASLRLRTGTGSIRVRD